MLKAISLDAKSSTVRFLAVDSINLLIAIAPNPGVFETVEEVIQRLTSPLKPLPAAVILTFMRSLSHRGIVCKNQLFNPGARIRRSGNGGRGMNGAPERIPTTVMGAGAATGGFYGGGATAAPAADWVASEAVRVWRIRLAQ